MDICQLPFPLWCATPRTVQKQWRPETNRRRVHLPTLGCKCLFETLYLNAARVTPTVHATRSFMAQTQGEKVLLKLDVKNAFNSIHWDTVLQAARTHLPEIYLSHGTVILEKHFSFMKSSALTQPLVCSKGPYRPGSFCPCHSRRYIQSQIRPKCLVPWWWMYRWKPADRAQ